jgi:DNA polymerase-3 subunit epsilon
MILFFDTETNDLIKYNLRNEFEKHPRIVQLAWELYNDDGDIYNNGNYIIYPMDFIISEESSAIHGITMQDALDKGIGIHTALKRFNDDVDACDMIIAHNLEFDLPVINTEFLRAKIQTDIMKKRKFCTMKSSNVISFCEIPFQYGDGYKWPSLSELYKQLFDRDFDGGHDASEDVKACAKCFFELRDRGIIEVY